MIKGTVVEIAGVGDAIVHYVADTYIFYNHLGTVDKAYMSDVKVKY